MALGSCQPSTDYGEAPTITFKDYEKLGNDSAIRLTIGYKDGDGDLGLKKDQTEPPFDSGSRYYNNLFIKYYEQFNGEFRQTEADPLRDTDTIGYYYRIPYITPDSRNKSIEGEITTTIEEIQIASVSFPNRNYDGQIRFEIKIVDRELRESNTVSSPPIPWSAR